MPPYLGQLEKMYTNVGHKERSGDVPVMLHNKGYLPHMMSAWTS